jgi:hypothetical protein
MTRPKEPIKPYEPYKPIKPEKKLAHNTCIGSIEIANYSSFTLKELEERLCMGLDNLDPNNLNFEFVVEEDTRYCYDDTTHHIAVRIFSMAEIDDPDYERKLSLYEKELDKYTKEYAKYKEKKKAYKDKIAQYELEMDEYNLQWAKQQVKRYEEKLTKEKTK